jgi:hypothetical protein
MSGSFPVDDFVVTNKRPDMARLLKLSLPRTPAEWIYRRDGALAVAENSS